LGLGIVGAHDIKPGIIPHSQRRYLRAEFRQELENAVVDGKEGKNITINIEVLGIEGELQDHLLLMNYATQPGVDEPELHQDREILRSLVNSFRPLKVIDSESKRLEMQSTADEKFEEFIKMRGAVLFGTELGILLLRLKDWDMNEPEQRLKAIELLLPFETFAKEIKLTDEKLDAFWASLHKAKEGDASEFKTLFIEMWARLQKGLKSWEISFKKRLPRK